MWSPLVGEGHVAETVTSVGAGQVLFLDVHECGHSSSLRVVSFSVCVLYLHKTFRSRLPSHPCAWNIPLIHSFIPGQETKVTPSLSCMKDPRPGPENEAPGSTVFCGWQLE